MWDLWWTKWHWDRFFSEFFNFFLPISFHQGSILIYIILELIIGSLEVTVQK
jgi:hypothetical protein